MNKENKEKQEKEDYNETGFLENIFELLKKNPELYWKIYNSVVYR